MPEGSRERPRPRVMLVSASLGGGGAERQLADMANYWAARGIGVTLVTWSGPDVADFYALEAGVRRQHLDLVAGRRAMLARIAFNLRRIRTLRKLLVAERPDVVLSFITENNVLTILAGVGLTARLVVSERAHPAHDTTVPLVWRALRRSLYSKSDEVVAQTPEAAQWIERYCHARSRVIPNALRELPALEQEREPLIIAVGRLVHQKGFDLLLRAFVRVAGEFPNWSVAVIGEGPERANLQQLRDELGLATRVSFAGQVHDIEAWLARAGLVVQPSRFEGFPNAVLEAMGMGAAVISADCPAGPADLIEDGVNGRLVPVGDVEALADALGRLMAQPAVRARLGREAAKVRERFRQDRIMAQWEASLLPHLGRSARALEI